MDVSQRGNPTTHQARQAQEIEHTAETGETPTGFILLEKEFGENYAALTVNSFMVVGLLARWSPFSPYHYNAQPTLLGSPLETFEADLHERLIAAGLDRTDGMFAQVVPYHFIYDALLGASDYTSHQAFIDYLGEVAEHRKNEVPADEAARNQRWQTLHTFDRLRRGVSDTIFRYATYSFVKTGTAIPLEQFQRELTLHYLDPQYEQDVFEQEVVNAVPTELDPVAHAAHIQRLEQHRRWGARQHDWLTQAA